MNNPRINKRLNKILLKCGITPGKVPQGGIDILPECPLVTDDSPEADAQRRRHSRMIRKTIGFL
jgi:hypothetical protein